MESNLYILSMASLCPPLGETKDYKRLIPNANLRRRMSRLVKMGVACAMECLQDRPVNQLDAILTASNLGFLEDTERFMEDISLHKGSMLNPTPFIQSTFNTLGAQIALLIQSHAYNMTYVDRGNSFQSVLLDATLLLNEGKRYVLIGAFDEKTANSSAIEQRLPAFKGKARGEGTTFFLLSNQKTENRRGEILNRISFRGEMTREERSAKIGRFLSESHIQPHDIRVVTHTDDTIHLLFPQARSYSYIAECGDYGTADAYGLYQTLLDMERQGEEGIALLYHVTPTFEHSLILLKREAQV